MANKITMLAGEPQEYIAIPKAEYDKLKRIEAEYLTFLEQENRRQIGMINNAMQESALNQLVICQQMNTL